MLNPHIRKYVYLVDLLADLLGSKCETVLHDISDPKHSIVKIRNGHVTNRELGGPITDLGLTIIKDNGPETILYTGKTKDAKVLRCGGVILRDELGKIVGFLCINIDITTSPQDELNSYVPNGNYNQQLEHYEMNIDDLIKVNISDILVALQKNIENLTREEKLQILKKLDEKGVFLIRGAVKKVSEMFSLSNVSIYKYLACIRKKEGYKL